GWICADSGIDRSNQNAEGEVTLLPEDADRSAAHLRERIAAINGESPAVVITDTFGRPWRLGQVDFAIGAAGFAPLDDARGRADWRGRPLEHTCMAVADQLAAAAGLVMHKGAGTPAVLIRGFEYPSGPGRAADLVRPADEDLFR
ncbi:MAG: F420-0--gamma-glutamyl ligase, partial [Candidatus Dadabacteria bacterium]